MKKLIEHLEALANLNGATLQHPSTLTPMSIECFAKRGDFSRGVLSTIVEVYRLAGQTAEGRKAIHDLGLEPFQSSTKGDTAQPEYVDVTTLAATNPPKELSLPQCLLVIPGGFELINITRIIDPLPRFTLLAS